MSHRATPVWLRIVWMFFSVILRNLFILRVPKCLSSGHKCFTILGNDILKAKTEVKLVSNFFFGHIVSAS